VRGHAGRAEFGVSVTAARDADAGRARIRGAEARGVVDAPHALPHAHRVALGN
jgi:hypothetical protein